MEEAIPHPEGSLIARVEYHPDICDACGAGEEEEDVIAYVSASEIKAEKDGRSFQEVKIETKILLSCGEERAIYLIRVHTVCGWAEKYSRPRKVTDWA
jgi:hypothetical protein